MDKKFLGQVFTPEYIVEKMINLISNKNPELVLEPSSGAGNFYIPLLKKFKNVIGIEIDKNIAHENAIIKSYFDTKYKPDVIIGNPPYVEFKNITNIPWTKFLKHKPNLYLFFLEKALEDLKENGELVLIVPASIFTNSSAKNLNKFIFENFSITHFELIPENVWENASVPTTIIKLVKIIDHKEKIEYFMSNGKILFGKKPTLPKNIIVKVGGASGFNSSLKKGDVPFVVSSTERTNLLKKIEYIPSTWIRPVPKPPKDFTFQIFVNCKTRNTKPFYILKNQEKSKFINYDASVLCLFVTCDKEQTISVTETLNSINWKEMGILRDGRFHFTQSVLAAIV